MIVAVVKRAREGNEPEDVARVVEFDGPLGLTAVTMAVVGCHDNRGWRFIIALIWFGCFLHLLLVVMVLDCSRTIRIWEGNLL